MSLQFMRNEVYAEKKIVPQFNLFVSKEESQAREKLESEKYCVSNISVNTKTFVQLLKLISHLHAAKPIFINLLNESFIFGFAACCPKP